MEIKRADQIKIGDVIEGEFFYGTVTKVESFENRKILIATDHNTLGYPFRPATTLKVS